MIPNLWRCVTSNKYKTTNPSGIVINHESCGGQTKTNLGFVIEHTLFYAQPNNMNSNTYIDHRFNKEKVLKVLENLSHYSRYVYTTYSPICVCPFFPPVVSTHCSECRGHDQLNGPAEPSWTSRSPEKWWWCLVWIHIFKGYDIRYLYPPTLPRLGQGRAAPGTTVGVERCFLSKPPSTAPLPLTCFGLPKLTDASLRPQFPTPVPLWAFPAPKSSLALAWFRLAPCLVLWDFGVVLWDTTPVPISLELALAMLRLAPWLVLWCFKTDGWPPVPIPKASPGPKCRWSWL